MNHKHRLHELDPDWQTAHKHGQASKTGMINHDNHTQLGQNQICQCCNEHVTKQPVDIWIHSKQLQFLGFGFPLFYQFLKFCMMLLVISICSYHVMSLQEAVYQNYQLCHTPKATSVQHRLLSTSTSTQSTTESSTKQMIVKCYTFLIQISRIQSTYNRQEQTLRIVSFVLQLLTLLYIRNNLIKLQAYYDERSTTLADYSIIIKGINKKNNIRKSIIEFISQEMGKYKYTPNIQQIILLPQFEQLTKLKQQQNDIINKLRPYYSSSSSSSISSSAVNSQNIQINNNIQDNICLQLQKQLAKINQKILTYGSTIKQKIKQDNLQCERAIIILNSQQDKINILQEYKNKSNDLLSQYFGSGNIRIEQAPQPQQIIWQNMNIPGKDRFLNILLGWSLSLILLAGVFIIFYFILVQKSLILQESIQKLAQHPQDKHYKSQYTGAIGLVYILMFLVVLFDKMVLATLFHKFTQLQRHNSTSNLQFSFALKYALGLFFTTALMTLAVQAIKFHNYYSHPYGVIDQQSIMFIMNSLFIPIFWLINPMRIFKIIKRYMYKGKKNLTQHQANKLMEEQSYDLGKRFAEIIQMMWFVYLYSTLIPIGAVITVFGLFLYYWVDKYNLLRRSKVHGKISGHFIQTSLTLLDLTLIFRPIGSIIFDSQIRYDSYFISNMVMICVAFVYILFPKNYFIELFNQEYFRPEEKQYKDVKSKFYRNYYTEHPLFSTANIDGEIQSNIVIESLYNTNQHTIFKLNQNNIGEENKFGKDSAHILLVKNKNDL